jgi:hypothetical protein
MSHIHCTIARGCWAATASLCLVAAAGGRAATPKFFSDDPIAVVVDSQDASNVIKRDIDLAYDTIENLLGRPGDPTPNVRAQNVSTVDEVPDSSWFTNRLGAAPMTVEELLKGPDTTDGPEAGSWTVIAAKVDGVTPGFTVRDAAGQVWFLKFDPPGYRAMATGTEIVVSKLMWALGYHVPEVHIASLSPDRLTVGERATISINGRTRSLKRADINAALHKAHRDPDGSYRVIASKALAGQPLGGFRFYGTRSDDPNDVIAHEHRRELRGYGTFAAWLNHVDSKSINTLDTLVDHGGRKIVRHHLLDFGSTIGSAGVYPREPYEGSEYLIEGKKTLAGIPTLGLYVKQWRTAPRYRSTTVGSFPTSNVTWDPEQWKPRYANSAFRAARMDDKFWAARRLQLVTTDMLRAVTQVGQFNDPESEAALAKFLIDRRNAIVRRYLVAVNPIVDVQLPGNGELIFANAAVDADVASIPMEYVAGWFAFDNATGAATAIGTTRSAGSRTSVPVPADLPASEGVYVRAEIAAMGGPAAWTQPVHAYFVRQPANWRLVGFERVPDGNAPQSAAPRVAAARPPFAQGGRSAGLRQH